ncbi:hypothetical protein CAEBREN_32100 [Caenorhabditis brenneri]|uniref:CBN-LIPS-17 protein n=1 Tax=Caenorhabditis brenneri TaxID=135651 RepID=G0PJ34_CAEBE|nr:CBN-LIPS-17 protein [Caenorhabditis brenneri]EGT58717.1 hypothetical protein CAEBREN_32100 [Caenorhabditis brenneri]
MPSIRRFLFFSFCIFNAFADFSPSFNKYLIDNYGKGINDLLARRDIGGHGSYGGGTHDGSTRTSKQAVVLVHGITNTAGTFQGHRHHLLNAGWSDELVRYMIQVVAAFTHRKVDVIGYSLGSPIARKAILGGACVDTGENLGPSLTGLIDTYVSVAGANRGSFLCALPFPGACNMKNGLSCMSEYIKDINSRPRYEGKYIFSIYGPGDDKVGYRNTCGQLCSQIAGANAEFERPGNHDDVLIKTAALQFKLIDQHAG